MVDKYEKKFGHNSIFIYDTVKDMTAYFVPQAPCCLTSNLRPEKGLSNGTQGRLHSIVLHADEAQSRAQEIRDAGAGTVVMLDFPPFCVTIAIDASALSTSGMQHEDASKAIVPLMQVQRKINIHRYIAVRNKGGGSLYTHAHPFRLTFGSTYHGVQCRSMDKIILVVDDKSLPALTYNAFYVGISRVRTGARLRVIRLRNHEEAPEDWRGRLKSLVPKVMVVRYMLKTSYENDHNLLKAMYREWDIDYDMRGHDKRMHRKASKKSPKKGTFPCSTQCGRVFTTTHHRRPHEANCKHNPSNAGQEDNGQYASIVEPPSSGERPINTPSPVARKKQCTGTHTNTRERLEMEGDIIDTVLQPALDEDTFINAATEARTLLDEHGQQRLERKGKQRVRANNISPTATSKRRQHSSSSTPSTTLHTTSPPKASALSPQCSVPEFASRETPIRSSSSSSSSSPSMHGPPTAWVPCHISSVPGSRFQDHTWQETTIVSTDQKTVHTVNGVMLQRFAIARGLPIVAWRLPMVDKYEKKFGHNSIFIYDTVKDMTAYFVPQAPCCLTSNLRPEKGLSNGTQGRLHSIVLHADEAQSRAQEIRDAGAGTVVMLDFPPFCVTIAIDASALSTSGMQHEDASKVIVPLMQVQRKINIHRYIAVRNKGGGSLYTHAHPFRLTFGSTYHGVQCRSMDKIILVVDDKSLRALTYNAFYVGISRVRTGAGLRVIRLRNHEEAPEDWRGRLKSLVPKVMVVRYMLKTSYENDHNLLKAMYREWDIDYDMRGHDKRMHRKASKKSPKKGTFPCSTQCGRVFTTTHHRRLHEANCKHNPSNTGQEDNVQDASIVEPPSSGERPINTPSPVARKKQCTGTHKNTRERLEMEGDIIDTVCNPPWMKTLSSTPLPKHEHC